MEGPDPVDEDARAPASCRRRHRYLWSRRPPGQQSQLVRGGAMAQHRALPARQDRRHVVPVHRWRFVPHGVDAVVNAAQPPVLEPALHRVAVDPLRHDLRPRHATVLALSDPDDRVEFAAHAAA
jgi:hypothetical protein